MAIALTFLPKYTYDDYIHWEGRWELIEGHPIAMSPMPIPLHQQVQGNLFIELKESLKRICNQCKIYLPLDYKITDGTTLQPDLLIVCDKINKSFLDFPPVLVVEILSPSTALKDRNTKYQIYEQEGVRYYLIVDVDKKSIEIYQLMNGSYALQPYKNGFEFKFDQGCSIAPELDNIWE